MKLSSRTIEVLVKFILGEHPGLEYKKGKEIVKFFNYCLGEDKIYSKDFPSRSEYTESELKRLNGSDNMIKVVQEACDPTYCDSYLADVIAYLNQFLTKDGYVAKILFDEYRTYIKVSCFHSELVDFPNKTIKSEFIKEQIDKCNSKIRINDLDGAITNARSLLEAVMEHIIKGLGHEIPKYDGNLLKLYKSLKEHLNLDPNKDMDDLFKQIASGLISCITGVAGISNKTSDRHCRKYKPLPHHAGLAVNSAFTICKFLLGVFENKKIQLLP